MTAADLTKLFAVMQPGDRERIASAVRAWQAVRDEHGDAGLFAFALVALMLHAAVPVVEGVSA